MKKNITIYLLLALACLGLQSCLFQEENYFDDSSANRATADVNRCSELLKAAPNGWVMEYYIGKDYSLGGITLLCRFDGQRVTMASQMSEADETVSSLYSVKSEQATMLSFDTYNYLVHYFGQPQGSMSDDPNGTLGGDYEFIISSASAERIELKGKKYGNRIVMKALTEDQTWKQYLTKIKKVEDDAFFYEYDLLMDGLYTGQMIRSNYTFILTYYDEIGKVHQKTVPFMFTADGLRFHEPVTIDGQTMQNFVWKNELISFVCTDEGATGVKLAGVYTAGYQSYDYYPGTYQMDFYRLNDETKQLEVASQEVRLLKNEDGKSYWLKGLEYDILVMFDAGLTSGEVTYEPDVLSGAVSAAAAVSEKLMEHKVPHYLGMWAGNKIYLNQITGQQEYDNTMDTWMNLSLQKERGMGLKSLIAEKSHSNYRRILYFTAGTCPDEVYELAKDVSVTAVCILDEEGEVRTTERGMCVLTEIPLEKLTTDMQNIIV